MSINNKKIVFSAIQPSGTLTIGNYIGALRKWVSMQEEYNCIYCIVDQHAMTVYQDPLNFRKNIFDTLALYLACGIDYNKSIIFIQSHVPQHTQLNWILSCHTYFGELNRMIQFKQNLLKNSKNINVGLFNYPLLMVADILLYQTNKVPVSVDQKQHLELSRNIARRFNTIYGEIFTIPEYWNIKNDSLVMSLQEPEKKMSKSDINDRNIISLLEKPDLVIKKIKEALTDSNIPPKICYDIKNKPGISNLIYILSTMTDQSISDIEKYFFNKMYFEFKNIVAEVIIKKLVSIQNKFYEFRDNEKLLCDIISEGAIKAGNIANKTLTKIYNAIGLI